MYVDLVVLTRASRLWLASAAGVAAACATLPAASLAVVLSQLGVVHVVREMLGRRRVRALGVAASLAVLPLVWLAAARPGVQSIGAVVLVVAAVPQALALAAELAPGPPVLLPLSAAQQAAAALGWEAPDPDSGKTEWRRHIWGGWAIPRGETERAVMGGVVLPPLCPLAWYGLLAAVGASGLGAGWALWGMCAAAAGHFCLYLVQTVRLKNEGGPIDVWNTALLNLTAYIHYLLLAAYLWEGPYGLAAGVAVAALGVARRTNTPAGSDPVARFVKYRCFYVT